MKIGMKNEKVFWHISMLRRDTLSFSLRSREGTGGPRNFSAGHRAPGRTPDRFYNNCTVFPD